ncbi:membrane protein implicated in regulation of membrane protease activity [Paenibacillus sp. PastF-3]|uniref:hypothetical protein n=1 Tax=Paenibacillus sp. PastF-3 TaxID=2940626 RepID=UPI0024733C6F|nr:hypothetical protein [Paenibacillus sp. PastF-3]MDH6373497.1 membrane protein implicated in regulation of membrane protease activity [Paenibacillus sp. PastF-3]
MLDTLTYILLGIFDATAAVLLILKLYMLPVKEYRFKIISFAIFIALFSYLMRMLLNVPKIDLPSQYILFVLFLRFGMQVKTHIASFIAGAGICAYAIIQMTIFYVYDWMDLIHVGILSENNGLYLYFFQTSCIAITLLLSILLSKFNFGFSFIIKPPHDFFSKENYLTRRNVMLLLGSIVSLLTVSVTVLLLYSSNPLGLLIIAAISFIISFYFSGRSDKDDIRKAIEAYSDKNKVG